jgi:hypothetical protein
MPRGGRGSLQGTVERGIKITRLRFDHGRFLGLLKQRADLDAPPVDRNDEKTGLAGAEELADLLQLFLRDRMQQVSGDASRTRQTTPARCDRGGTGSGSHDEQRGPEHSTSQGQIPGCAVVTSTCSSPQAFLVSTAMDM